ncbi:TIGR02281 family clan AA aspartic protease [Sphingomonadaceae bacterium jetA1]|uniref:retropepsin-like aspartic protease family protein n=1 Tax=Facivitalis istanbulensis TaxID=3075838 RepID=UPI00346A4428
MTTDQAMDVVYYGLVLLLPLSALAARRIPMKQTLIIASIWVAIFAGGYLFVAQRDRLMRLMPGSTSTVGTARIMIGADGHYRASVRLNGVERPMLIDSGAATTALSIATARAARIPINDNGFPRLIETANGTVTAQPVTIERMAIGDIVLHDVDAVVSPSFGEQDVIGMNVLNRMNTWRVEGGTLILDTR